MQREDYQNILKLRGWAIAFTSYIKLFPKTKSGLELISLLHFQHDFWRRIFLMLYFINWPNLLSNCLCFLGILSNLYIVLICFPVCDAIDFVVILLVYFRSLKLLVLRVILYSKIFAKLHLIKRKVWHTLYCQTFARFNKLFFLHLVKLSTKWGMFFQLSMTNNVILWFLTYVSTWYDV